MLKHHPDFLTHAFDVANIFIQFDTIHNNTPLLMLLKVIDAANGCRFPGPGRAAKDNTFALLDLKIDIFQDEIARTIYSRFPA